MRSAPLFFLAVVAVVLASCSSSSTSAGGSCTEYVVPATTNLSTPQTSYQMDVIPIIEQSCALEACHGSKQSNLGIYFPADPAAIYTTLIGPSTTLPSMQFVKGGDLKNSFLMLKLDGDQCLYNSECVKGTCGGVMPLGNQTPFDSQLPVAQRDVFRRWISQGAKQN